MQRSVAALVGLVLLAAACTSSPPDATPSPTPSGTSTAPSDAATSPAPGRVAVVIAPAPPLVAAAAEIGVRGVGARMLDGAELRVATADSSPFVRDLADFFASEGYDLVCVLGAGAETVVREVAPTSPSTRFCASPATGEGMPSNVLAIDVRVEEMGYLAGIALAADGLRGPAGLVTARTTWDPQRLAAGLTAGLAAGGVEAPEVRSGAPLRDDEAAVERTTELLEAGVAGLVSWAGALDATVLEVIEDTAVTAPEPPAPPTDAPATDPASPSPTTTETEPSFASLVAGPEARPSEDGAATSERLLAIMELHLEQAVAVAIGRHIDGWDTTPASVGLEEGAFRIDVGDGERGRAVTDTLAGAQRGIRDGEIQIPLE